MDLKDTYNKIAGDWSKDHEYSSWWKEIVSKLLSKLKPGARVLDIGCGAGWKAKFISEKGFKVVGIDFSEKMIELARVNAPEAEFLVHDMSMAETLSGTFDLIFAQAVLLHVKKNKVLEVLNNWLKKLNSGGYLYIAVKEAWLNSPDEELVKENDYGYEYERFFSYYTLDELKKYLEHFSLKFIESAKVVRNGTTWLVIIGQK